MIHKDRKGVSGIEKWGQSLFKNSESLLQQSPTQSILPTEEVCQIQYHTNTAAHKLTNNLPKEALIFLREAEKLLENVAQKEANIDVWIFISVMINQACAHQQIWALDKTEEYLGVVVRSIEGYGEEEEGEDKENGKEDTIEGMVEKLMFVVKVYMRYAYLCSQLGRRTFCIEYLEKALKILLKASDSHPIETETYSEKSLQSRIQTLLSTPPKLFYPLSPLIIEDFLEIEPLTTEQIQNIFLEATPKLSIHKSSQYYSVIYSSLGLEKAKEKSNKRSDKAYEKSSGLFYLLLSLLIYLEFCWNGSTQNGYVKYLLSLLEKYYQIKFKFDKYKMLENEKERENERENLRIREGIEMLKKIVKGDAKNEQPNPNSYMIGADAINKKPLKILRKKYQEAPPIKNEERLFNNLKFSVKNLHSDSSVNKTKYRSKGKSEGLPESLEKSKRESFGKDTLKKIVSKSSRNTSKSIEKNTIIGKIQNICQPKGVSSPNDEYLLHEIVNPPAHNKNKRSHSQESLGKEKKIFHKRKTTNEKIKDNVKVRGLESKKILIERDHEKMKKSMGNKKKTTKTISNSKK